MNATMLTCFLFSQLIRYLVNAHNNIPTRMSHA